MMASAAALEKPLPIYLNFSPFKSVKMTFFLPKSVFSKCISAISARVKVCDILEDPIYQNSQETKCVNALEV